MPDCLLTISTRGVVAIMETGAKSLAMSYLSCRVRAGALAKEVAPMSKVRPSGLARETYSAAMLPPAPALFSTMTAVCHRALSDCATMRATRSVVPPGANGTIRDTRFAPG